MIEEAIHEILADREDVDSVSLFLALPDDRIVTGTVHDRRMDMPNATVNVEANPSEYRSNTSSARRPRIRFQIWCEDHKEGCEIRDKVVTLFENKKIKTTNSKIISIRHENDFAIEETDGVWQFVVDFETINTKGGCNAD